MAALLDIRRRIRSVKSTQQITRAMKMVAAARLRRAQDRIFNARPYANQMMALLSSVAARTTDRCHPLLLERPIERQLLVLITADRGLCGGFNTNLIRAAQSYLDEHRERDISDPVGRQDARTSSRPRRKPRSRQGRVTMEVSTRSTDPPSWRPAVLVDPRDFFRPTRTPPATTCKGLRQAHAHTPQYETARSGGLSVAPCSSASRALRAAAGGGGAAARRLAFAPLTPPARGAAGVGPREGRKRTQPCSGSTTWR